MPLVFGRRRGPVVQQGNGGGNGGNGCSPEPCIASLSGTVAHGNSVTLTGAGFGTKNPAKPRIWAHFEGESMVSDPDLSTGTLTINNVSLTQVDTAHGLSAWAVRGIPNDGGTKHNPSLLWATTADSVQTVYMAVRRKYADADFFQTNVNYKFSRFWPQCNTGFPNTVGNVGSPQTVRVSNEGPTFNLWSEIATPPQNAWIREEYIFRHSGIDANDGTFILVFDGTTHINTTTQNSRSAANPSLWGCIRAENFWTDTGGNGPPKSGAFVYFDDCYIDDTWARVMISNNSDFNASGIHREVQIPTAWANNEITFVVNQGAHASLSGQFIHVVLADGTVTNGLAIP